MINSKERPNVKQNKLHKIIDALSRRQLLNWIPDSAYLKLRFRVKAGYRLNLQTPITFNEKLQWLKIYNHNAAYIKMVDKYAVKKYVARLIGEKYIIPNVGGPWKSFDDIDFELLPSKFVLNVLMIVAELSYAQIKIILIKNLPKGRLIKH